MSATDITIRVPQCGNTTRHKAAHDLLALGINEDLAPDVDVNLVNGYDMVTRTFGNDPDEVVTYASAYIERYRAMVLWDVSSIFRDWAMQSLMLTLVTGCQSYQSANLLH